MEIRTILENRQPLENPNSNIDFKVKYERQFYQEIRTDQDFGFESMWSSVGGFVGILLGYSLLQLLEFITGLEKVYEKLANAMGKA